MGTLGSLIGKHCRTLFWYRHTEKLSGSLGLFRNNRIMADGDLHGLTDEEAATACSEPDPSTKDFIFQQTMYRIKDAKKSLDFYTRILGMRLLKKCDFPAMKFTIYFMGFESKEDIPTDEKERGAWAMSRKATLELTHNWGTENDPSMKYHNGNTEPRGFGHIGILVPCLEKACARFEELGVTFVKRPTDGQLLPM
ncbi:unnamed protein product [Darwinula stevensoni]|uniref:Lactoylglutathione lyase n=1 Tax=Darwinula stevensoni TaxID=69355 RepID=A0A7R9FNC0_9CRUS|nr:unnamed protein product [Darwinula stevensoni]CAG0896232.1 unnamed protein product [Darwinula stevensoni]